MAKEFVPFTVTCAGGEEANGIANIMQALLVQNFANKPNLTKTARKMRHPVTIVNTDTDTECTLDFANEGITIYNGIVGEPRVALYINSDQLLQLSQMKVKAGGKLPVGLISPRSPVLRQVLSRQIVIKGMLSHYFATGRALALISLAD
ncbi:hypothetical protein [Sporichthya sp.]|uniref:hypothetical protein n=1 Tax=Sporichthya sp. TaxID=65475 RepID=UPI001836EA91|nr:hypothetical protein [Sporichthya sp.]MBA3741749.1 hypothetical protein [Sporichthya sp.]